MATFTYSNTTGIATIDENGGPYNQTVDVHGTLGAITDVDITLTNLQHTWAGDLDMLLVAADDTTNLQFLSDLGVAGSASGDNTNFDGNYTFSDGGDAFDPTLGGGDDFPSGTYAPFAENGSNIQETDAEYGSATGGINPAGPIGAGTFGNSFGGLSGTNVNGLWNLFIADDSNGDDGSLGSWSVDVTTDSDAALIEGTAGVDTITVTSTGGTGSWIKNGDVVAFTGLTGGITIRGGEGADMIIGDDEDEIIEGGAGGDTLSGGGEAGNGDTLSYASSNAGVFVDLSQNSVGGFSITMSHASGDTISGFENVIGSGFRDRLVVDGMSDGSFEGGGGNDTFLFRDLGLTSPGLIDGGSGMDTLLFGETGHDPFLGAAYFLKQSDIQSIERIEFAEIAENAVHTVLFDASQVSNGQLDSALEVVFDNDIFTHEFISFELDTSTTIDLSGFGFSNAFGGPVFSTSSVVIESLSGDDDVITGSSIRDEIFADIGNDTIDSGGGDDELTFYEDFRLDGSMDTWDGGSGDDTASFQGYHSAVRVDLESVNEAITRDSDTMGSGTFRVIVQMENMENIYGSNFSDQLWGDADDNVIFGDEGDDNILGRLGNDELHGGDGNDFLFARQGADQMYGGAGNDRIIMDSLDTFISGGADYDRVSVAGSGGVTLDMTTSSIERAAGNSGNDTFDATGKSDFRIIIQGNGGIDTLSGGELADSISGGSESDTIFGNGGADKIYGEAGSDTLNGGLGRDQYFGGAGGFDVFEFSADWDRDIVRDFDVGMDTIRFDGVTDVNGDILDFGDLTLTQDAFGNARVFVTGVTANTITLQGVDFNDLGSSDFDLGTI